MSEDYGSGSLAIFLIDKLTSSDWQPAEELALTYSEYLLTDHWKITSEKAKMRAGY
jgi:hypothetical protein